jgi:DNA-binding CsgD family transcriptional regulator
MLSRLDQLTAEVAGTTPPSVAASRATAAAELSRIRGPGDEGLWSAAAAAWEACANPYRAAYARWRRADALLSAGHDRSEAAALIREAHTTAVRLGSRPLREALRRLARRARIDLDEVQPPTSPPNPLIERLELTPRELEVLALLADGMTNREIASKLFISDKTASVHVSRILSKLDVPNRTAAASLAHQLGISRSQIHAETD